MFKLIEYFSFYVLLWYFLYILNIITFNPIVILYIILSFVLWMVSYMIYIKLSLMKIMVFTVLAIILVKVIPILTLTHEFNPYDVLFGFTMFFIYYIILYITKGIEPIQLYINYIKYYQQLPDNLEIIIKKIIPVNT
jgi:hypothetical protein